MTTTTTHAAQAAEFIATEVAWNGSASVAWVASKLDRAGFTADAEAIVAFAVESGLLREIPRLGGYTVSRRVNAAVFGETFAEWVAA